MSDMIIPQKFAKMLDIAKSEAAKDSDFSKPYIEVCEAYHTSLELLRKARRAIFESYSLNHANIPANVKAMLGKIDDLMPPGGAM